MIFHHICFFQLFCKVLAFFANSPFDQGHLAESQLNFSHSFCDLSPYIFFFNFSVRFWPFLPIRHLTRDISLSRHYIFVARFVIFHHICHFNLSGYVFVGFELPVISTNLFTFFWHICQFHPFGEADSPFYQKNLLQPYLRGNFRLLLVLYLLPEFTGPTVSITWTKY